LYKSGQEIVELVKDQYDYFILPLSYRKGTFFKKEKVEITNPFEDFKKYHQEEFVERTQITKFNIDNFPSEENYLQEFGIDQLFTI
jgi:hypothetical protein